MTRKTSKPTAYPSNATLERFRKACGSLTSQDALSLIDALRYQLDEEAAFRASGDMSGRWYRLVVRGYALEIARMVKDGEVADTSEIDDATTSMIDDCQEVIYTYKAQRVVAESSNAGAYEDQIGEPPTKVEAQACMALIEDVREELARWDVNADGLWEDNVAAAIKMIEECK